MSHPNFNDTVAIDIDGTLVLNGALSESAMGWIHKQRGKGFDVILWSIRGGKYAREVAEKFEISGLFAAIIGKPCAIVDDRGWGWARYSPAIHPGRL